MSEWLPGKTAPKDGSIFLTYFNEEPVFAGMCWRSERTIAENSGWLWWRKTTEKVIPAKGEFRALIYVRGVWGIQAQYAPFVPVKWMPLPAKWKPIKRKAPEPALPKGQTRN